MVAPVPVSSSASSSVSSSVSSRVTSPDARLVSVEIRTPAPEADRELLHELGWREPPAPGTGAGSAATGAEDGQDVAVLRSCADPYGVELRLVRGEGPGRLQWRPERRAQAEALADRLHAHPFGGWVQELRWEVDRPWVGGNALRCPLHAEDSAELCEAEPPLLERVGLAGAVGAGVVLTVRTPHATEHAQLLRAPGGWSLELLPLQRRPRQA